MRNTNIEWHISEYTLIGVDFYTKFTVKNATSAQDPTMFIVDVDSGAMDSLWVLFTLSLSFSLLWEPLFGKISTIPFAEIEHCIDRFSLLPSSVQIGPSISASVVFASDPSVFIFSAVNAVWTVHCVLGAEGRKNNNRKKEIKVQNRSGFLSVRKNVMSFRLRHASVCKVSYSVAAVLNYFSCFIHRIGSSRLAGASARDFHFLSSF